MQFGTHDVELSSYCSGGGRYAMYCANVARTYLVDPNKTQEEEYKALLSAQEAAIAALREGEPLSAVMAAGISSLQVYPTTL